METKTILITGSTEGLGKTTAKLLIAQGHNVIINSTRKNHAPEVAKELGADYSIFDVSRFDQVKNAFNDIREKYGKLDVLVNNAGIWIQGPIDQNDAADIERTYAVNLLGPVFCTKAFIEVFKKGMIIMINSQAGLFGKAERSVYNSTKWGLTGFTESLQQELTKDGLRIMSIHPSLIDTNLFKRAGIDRSMYNALDPREIANIISTMIELPENTYIPQIGIKHVAY